MGISNTSLSSRAMRGNRKTFLDFSDSFSDRSQPRRRNQTGNEPMNDQSLRQHVVYLLEGGGAHLDFERAVGGLPLDLLGARADGIPHSPWQLVEHMRICQWDILQFSADSDHVSPDFPDGYWPSTVAPPNPADWDRCLTNFREDLQAMVDLVQDDTTDLFAPIGWGDGQTILREALLVADHNAYHLGQLVTVRQALRAWP